MLLYGIPDLMEICPGILEEVHFLWLVCPSEPRFWLEWMPPPVRIA